MADLKNYKVYKNTQFEVLTDDGFKDFKGLIVGENRNKLKLEFDKGISLVCTPKHKLMINKKDFVYAKDLTVNDRIFNGITINNITKFESDEKVYEFLHVQDNHQYYVNDILSKNCLIVDEMA